MGDIAKPPVTPRGLLMVGSGSGTTMYPPGFAKPTHQRSAKAVPIGFNPRGEPEGIAAFNDRIPVRAKPSLPDGIDAAPPPTSLFTQTSRSRAISSPSGAPANGNRISKPFGGTT